MLEGLECILVRSVFFPSFFADDNRKNARVAASLPRYYKRTQIRNSGSVVGLVAGNGSMYSKYVPMHGV